VTPRPPACLQVVMAGPGQHDTLDLVESSDRIMELLDKDKTINAFAVMGQPSCPGARPSFLGAQAPASLPDSELATGAGCLSSARCCTHDGPGGSRQQGAALLMPSHVAGQPLQL
jgi:hypothetical protein